MSTAFWNRTSAERNGYCMCCRIVFAWAGAPTQPCACCPYCAAPLVRKPRKFSGRYSVESSKPGTRVVPTLTTREVEHG